MTPNWRHSFETLARACDQVGRGRGHSSVRDIAKNLRGAAAVGLAGLERGWRETVPVEAALVAIDMAQGQSTHVWALFVAAPHCQGGHSPAGMAIAEALGIDFPLTMDALAARAAQCGLDPAELWPWWKEQRQVVAG